MNHPQWRGFPTSTDPVLPEAATIRRSRNKTRKQGGQATSTKSKLSNTQYLNVPKRSPTLSVCVLPCSTAKVGMLAALDQAELQIRATGVSHWIIAMCLYQPFASRQVSCRQEFSKYSARKHRKESLQLGICAT